MYVPESRHIAELLRLLYYHINADMIFGLCNLIDDMTEQEILTELEKIHLMHEIKTNLPRCHVVFYPYYFPPGNVKYRKKYVNKLLTKYKI